MICHFCWILVVYHGAFTPSTPLTVVQIMPTQKACLVMAKRNQKKETHGRTWECLGELHYGK